MNTYGKSIPKSMNFAKLLGVAFGHEIKHASKEDVVYRMNNPKTEENPAIEISNKIIDELNKK
ncbi:hypothetical protein [Flavobacterium sp. FlaQc-47]|uniref:hypothetical protein n=1 Tax=Flavobacterium sp. FlaQc-47 TaxID=3374180 RepID=UPI003757BE73